MLQNEEQLVALLRQKDQLAFKKLVEESGNHVYNTALGILQHEEDAEDVSQEVFIEVFQSVHQFRGEARLSTWIYRITVTRALEYLRKKKRKRRFAFLQSLLGGEDPLMQKGAVDFYHPGIKLENKERASILFRAVSLLPENQKTAFVLAKVEGLSYAELAEVMNISVSSVESLMVRANRNLRSLLSSYYNNNEK